MSYNQQPTRSAPPSTYAQPPPAVAPPPYGYSMPPPPLGMIPGAPPVGTPPPVNFQKMTQPPPNVPPGEKPPTTTVFVGNISERAPDLMIRQMLQRCGQTISWKRVQGQNGKLQGFGFCEYSNPESTLRCIRLLNDYVIADKKLVVKVDQKTKDLLIEYKERKRKENEQKHGANKKQTPAHLRAKRKLEDEGADGEQLQPQDINLEMVDEDTLKEDRMVLNGLENILKQHQKELTTPPAALATPTTTTATPTAPATPAATENGDEMTSAAAAAVTTPTTDEQSPQANTDASQTGTSGGIYMKPHLRLEEIQIDADKKELITSEIQTFREKHKDEDVKIKQEEKQRMERIEREREREREREKERRDRDRDRDRERDNRRRSSSNHRQPARDQERGGGGGGDRDKERERDRDRVDRDNNRRRSTSIPKPQGPPLTPEEEEEERERRRLERKLKEKELQYREHLRQWEMREKKRLDDYKQEKKKEINRRKQYQKEGKKLKEFLEDYDDEKDDVNYYKGSNLAKRLKLREKEIEMDDRDREREKEEIEILKQKLLNQGKQCDNIDLEVKRIKSEENNKMRLKIESATAESSSSSSSSESEGGGGGEDGVDNGESEHEENSNKENENRRRQQQRSGADRHTSNNKYNSSSSSRGHYSSNNHHSSHHQSTSNSRHDDDRERDHRVNGSSATVKDVDMVEQQVANNEDSPSQMVNSDVEMKNVESYDEDKDKDTSLSPMQSTSDDNSSQLGQSSDMLSPMQSPQTSSNGGALGGAKSINYNFSLSSAINKSRQTTTLTQKSKQSVMQPINQVFAEDDDDDKSNTPQQKRAKLTTLEQERKAAAAAKHCAKFNADERKKAIEKLVGSIPTDREQLFKFNIDWSQLDAALMEKRIKPWVNRKIIDYIGEEEASLNEFICSKITDKVLPDKILEDVKVILDDEAEVFVKKMWRLIVYETESKRLGLSK